MEQKLRRDRRIGDNLRKLRDKHGISQEKLAKMIYINKSNVTRNLAVLEKNGYIERRPAENDKRVMLVFPTQKAQAASLAVGVAGALIMGKICTTVLFVSLISLVLFPNIDPKLVEIIAIVDFVFLSAAFVQYIFAFFGKYKKVQDIQDSSADA